MKPFELWKSSICSLSIHKKLWIWMLLYLFAAEFFLLKLTQHSGNWSGNLGIFDLLAHPSGWYGGTNHHMFILAGIPVLVVSLGKIVDFNETAPMLLKQRTRFQVWHANVLSAITLSALLAGLVMIISLIGGFLITGWENTWLQTSGSIGSLLKDNSKLEASLPNLAAYRVLLTVLATKFLGFLMISLLALFLKNFIKNDGFILIIVIALAGLDYTGVIRFPFFTMVATLKLQNWVEPITTVYQSLYMLVVSLILYSVSGWLYERKDFLS